MVYFIRKDTKAFNSAILKRKLSHTDKFDPNNLTLPNSIVNMKESHIDKNIDKILKKYKQKNYINFSRESLNTEKNWNDLFILILILFYKNNWQIKIEDKEEYFPHFLFTYNIEPLKKEIDKIIENIYNKIDSKASKKQLTESFTYTGLDLTYLLHYLSLDEEKKL